jgi:hypothetical protein
MFVCLAHGGLPGSGQSRDGQQSPPCAHWDMAISCMDSWGKRHCTFTNTAREDYPVFGVRYKLYQRGATFP